jgi:hypothetical protein
MTLAKRAMVDLVLLMELIGTSSPFMLYKQKVWRASINITSSTELNNTPSRKLKSKDYTNDDNSHISSYILISF